MTSPSIVDSESWPHFSEDEMRCKCGCGRADMDDGFMVLLEVLRGYLAFPLPVISGYRCPDHNARVSGTGRRGPHTTGRAVDIAVSGAKAFLLLEAAFAHGFTGIGVNQRGANAGMFIHLDNLTLHQMPRVWSY